MALASCCILASGQVVIDSYPQNALRDGITTAERSELVSEWVSDRKMPSDWVPIDAATCTFHNIRSVLRFSYVKRPPRISERVSEWVSEWGEWVSEWRLSASNCIAATLLRKKMSRVLLMSVLSLAQAAWYFFAWPFLDYQGPYSTPAIGGFTGKITFVEVTTGFIMIFLVKS